MGTKYNGCINIQNRISEKENLKQLDMERAYFNFQICEQYEGFIAKFTDFRELNISSERLSFLPLGMYMINNLIIGNKLNKINDKLNIWVNDQVYTLPELKMIKKNGASFNIICGAWGEGEKNFMFPESFKNKEEGVSWYAKFCGLTDI